LSTSPSRCTRWPSRRALCSSWCSPFVLVWSGCGNNLFGCLPDFHEFILSLWLWIPSFLVLSVILWQFHLSCQMCSSLLGELKCTRMNVF
jgi:hypothetical protein